MATFLIGVDKLLIGGAEQVAVAQANALLEAGHTVYVGVLRSTDKCETLYHRLKVLPENIIHFNVTSLLDIGGYVKIMRFVYTKKVDLVLSHLFESNIVFRVAGFFGGVPKLVAVVHSTYNKMRVWQRVLNFFLQFITTKIVAVSWEVAAYTQKREYILKGKLVVLSHVHDFATVRGSLRKSIREKLSVDEATVCVMSLGRFSSEKRQERIIEIARRFSIQDNGVPVRFFLIGYGPRERELHMRIMNNHLKNITLIVDPKNAREYLAGGDIFVLSSEREGMPIALLEGMYAGLAPVLFNVGGVSEVITDRETGLLVDGQSVDLLQRAIHEVVVDEELRKKIARNAQKRALSYNVGKKEFLMFIDSLI